MKKIIIIIILAVFANIQAAENLLKYVNPIIGTDAHGHTFPGASVPFGMVQLSPDTRLDGWDGCSAYHYSDSLIYGFSHTHLNGTGCSDYGDILIMPSVGKYSCDNKKYSSYFSHRNEVATPGYYSVKLNKDNIQAELTASQRCGVHRYTFPNKKDKKFIILDLVHRDEVLDAKIEFIDDSTIVGHRYSKAWAENRKLFFAIRFSKPILNIDIAQDNKLTCNGKFYNHQKACFTAPVQGKFIKAMLAFDKRVKELEVKVALSPVSCDNALNNLQEEVQQLNFNLVKANAEKLWQKELSKIIVEGNNQNDKIKFYTALYHTMLQPNIYSDVNGEYRGRDDKIHKSDFDYYTVFSLWDTYRAYHPLMTIIDTKRTNDWIKTFLLQYQQGGLLPVWELSANETYCMIGYHSVSVIADAIMKGIGDFNKELALQAMTHSANQDHLGLKHYKELQYIPADYEHESVSKTLEYAYDDWCIAQVAKEIGNNTIYEEFAARSQYYKNIFNPNGDFMQARYNGGWIKNFKPSDVNNNYTEGNSWQYSFYVPHDINNLINMHGGREWFYNHLDSMFSTSDALSGRHQVDITGLIGQYAHGNEPSHHAAYLFNYVNSPNRTQELVRKIMKEFYTTAPDGLIGNEDCGQMSAWFVLSAMGFYPVCPGDNQYIIGSPLFKKITVNLENGKQFVINAPNNSDENIYVQSIKVNGEKYSKTYFEHSLIQNGGEITFEMGKFKSNYGTRDIDCPKAKVENSIVLSPIIESEKQIFKDKMEVKISSNEKNADIYYTLDGTDPVAGKTTKYSAPFSIDDNTTVKAISANGDKHSPVTTAKLYKIQNDKTIKILSEVSPSYQDNGPEGLIDNLRGINNFKIGGWQGYQGTNFEAIIELNNKRTIQEVACGFLQDTRSWIVFPKEVLFYSSTDGVNFQLLGTAKPEIPIENQEVLTKDIGIQTKAEAKYIKVIAKYYGKLPEWHAGAGGETFIFIDEIIIK